MVQTTPNNTRDKTSGPLNWKLISGGMKANHAITAEATVATIPPNRRPNSVVTNTAGQVSDEWRALQAERSKQPAQERRDRHREQRNGKRSHPARARSPRERHQAHT